MGQDEYMWLTTRRFTKIEFQNWLISRVGRDSETNTFILGKEDVIIQDLQTQVWEKQGRVSVD